ncbi:unnamed protein product [Sphagnum jensenii]|uniref:DUF985 domain-containing protein n=1 Tax=Sphagnum jensenii TaxID=128206 RepID=A0ABP0VDT8_9BRYO
MHSKIEKYISDLSLIPHPEGGWYSETYRSDETTTDLPAGFTGARHFSTAIYFLVPGTTFSAFHRIRSDELWHFYDGDMLQVFVIDEAGALRIIELGRDTDQGQVFQAVVRRGTWFASRCAAPGGFSLAGCTYLRVLISQISSWQSAAICCFSFRSMRAISRHSRDEAPTRPRL